LCRWSHLVPRACRINVQSRLPSFPG
jgi:hypothetical protein